MAVNLLDDPTVAGVVLTTRDITHRMALEAQLMHRDFHDELTGLANRALFTNRVEQALLRAARNAGRSASPAPSRGHSRSRTARRSPAGD